MIILSYDLNSNQQEKICRAIKRSKLKDDFEPDDFMRKKTILHMKSVGLASAIGKRNAQALHSRDTVDIPKS